MGHEQSEFDISPNSYLSPHQVEMDHGLRLLARLIARAHIQSDSQDHQDKMDSSQGVADTPTSADPPQYPLLH